MKRLNVKTLLDIFTDNFKQNYSAWVEEEAMKAKQKLQFLVVVEVEYFSKKLQERKSKRYA